MRFSAVFTLFLFQIVSGGPLSKRWEDFQTKHQWQEVPKGWMFHNDAPADHMLEMRIALKQDKFDELVKHLYEVSDPDHERYGAHLTKSEVNSLVSPHSDTVKLVDEWLAYHGVDATSRSPAGDWLTITIPVSQAEQMLNAKYNVYRNPDTNSYVVRTTAYSLPRALHGHVDLVAPTTCFTSMRGMRRTSFLQPEPVEGQSDVFRGAGNNFASEELSPNAVPTSCNSRITPDCLRALYNTTSYIPRATDVNKIGVAGYLDEFANRNDLQAFFQRFRTDAVGAQFQTIRVNNGGDDQSDPGVEANLDIQYTEGMTFPTPNIYYSTGGSPPFNPDSNTPTNTNEPYLDWLNFVLNQPKSEVPQTFTTSYGDDEQTVPIDYAITVCNMFAQLGAQGSSILFSSGDFGVGGGNCRTNDGRNVVQFQPIFPASCPFVTAVGGTIGINPERAVSFTGGGFSNYFSQPSYQTSAVNTFLAAIGSQNKDLFNRTGRGFPDIAAQGQNFQVVVGGRVVSVGGTSASSPTFAGVVSLLNDFRIANGKSPLGFLNPLLYSKGSAGLNDITSGNNPGCGTQGFTARAGWDPVTGLGTPDFGKLQGIVLDI